MSLSPYRPVPRWQRALRSSAVGISIAAHVLLAMVAVSSPTARKQAAQWVEVAIQEAKPPPPPPELEPEPPKPEPPKPKPTPKAVKFEETTAVQPPPEAVAPPTDPPPRRVLRQVQGLTANSFAPGAGTGLSVRAGNTTGVKAGDATMSLEDATGPFEPRPYTAVTSAPRLRWSPTMDVPEEAQKAAVTGLVNVLLDIDEKGKVVRVKVVSDLGHGTGEACADAFRRSQWKPAEQGGTPVPVTGVPQSCLVTSSA